MEHPEIAAHRGYSVVSTYNQVRAVCTCGWRSEHLPNGGLAGAAWDQHKENPR